MAKLKPVLILLAWAGIEIAINCPFFCLDVRLNVMATPFVIVGWLFIGGALGAARFSVFWFPILGAILGLMIHAYCLMAGLFDFVIR